MEDDFDQDDPFKKYGGKQIEDPFKKYGGNAIDDTVIKKKPLQKSYGVGSVIGGLTGQSENVLEGVGKTVTTKPIPQLPYEDLSNLPTSERVKGYKLKKLQEHAVKPLSEELLTTENQIKISDAIVGANMRSEQGEEIPTADIKAKDELTIKHGVKGLNYLKEFETGRYNAIMRGIKEKGSISDADYETIMNAGQYMNNLAGETQTENKYESFQTKKAKAAGQIGEFLKKNLPEIARPSEYNESMIRFAAKELGINNESVIKDLIWQEDLFGKDAIPKGGGAEAFIRGVKQPFQGIMQTLDNINKSSSEIYLESKDLDRFDQLVPNEYGRLSTTLPSERKSLWIGAMEGLGQFSTQVLTTKGLGGAALRGAKAANIALKNPTRFVNISGTVPSIYLQEYGNAWEDAYAKTGNAKLANKMGFINAGAAALFELMLPDAKLADKAADIMRKGYASKILKVINEGGDISTIAKKGRPILAKYGKEVAKIVPTEISEEVGTNMVNYLDELIFSPQTAKDRDLLNETGEIVKATAIQMSIPALLGAGGSLKNDFTLETINDAALNLDEYKDALDKSNVSEEDKNKIVTFLEKHRQNLEATDPNLPIEERKEQALAQTKQDIQPPSALEKAVVEGRVKGVYADFVKEGKTDEVLADIAKQAQNLDQDGKIIPDGKDDLVLEATIEQFGEDVVDEAVGKFPYHPENLTEERKATTPQPQEQVSVQDKTVGEDMRGYKFPSDDEVYNIIESEYGRQGSDFIGENGTFENEQKARAYAKEVSDHLGAIAEQEYIPVYRVVKADEVDLDPYGIGESWSFELDAAKQFAKQNIAASSKDLKIISAYVPRENVNWDAAVRAYTNFSDLMSAESEFELPIEPNSKLLNVSVSDYKAAKKLPPKQSPTEQKPKPEQVSVEDKPDVVSEMNKGEKLGSTYQAEKYGSPNEIRGKLLDAGYEEVDLKDKKYDEITSILDNEIKRGFEPILVDKQNGGINSVYDWRRNTAFTDNMPYSILVRPKNLKNETIPQTNLPDKQSNIPPKEESKPEAETTTIEKGAGEEKVPPKEPPVEPPPIEKAATEGEENLPERRFTKQMLRTEELSETSKGEIAKTLNYIKQTNEMTVKEANEAIDKVGLDEAQNLVMNDADLKSVVRVTVGQILIRKYNELADKATEQADKDYYLDKTIQTANFVTEKLATEAGQSIQAFSMWSRLSPEGQLRAANQDMAAQGKEKMRRREGDINKIGDKFQKANEETAEEITKTTKPKVEKTESERIKKAKDKIEAAKKRRENIIKKYKGDKGKNLYSSPTGLTKEGIEFVGDLLATYMQEGVAKLEIIVDKILTHLKEVSGKQPNDEVRKNVTDIVKERIDKDADKRIKSSLYELEKNINEIVKKHYTIPEEAKKPLVDKFMDKAGLEKQEAEQLAKEIQDEFDKIASRKKRNILYNEKARFDKIQKTLKGAKQPESKTVQSEIIKYSNLGAFENKDFAELIGNKFGIGEISTEQAAKLKELADKVQKAPEGTPKRDATEDLLAYRAKLRGNDLGETVQGVYYANILSGYKTHEKNLVSTFFNSMGELGAEMLTDPKAIPYIIAGYLKGLKRGGVEAKHTLQTGRSPIHIKKIETPSTLERKSFIGGNFNPGNWFKYVTRLMVAEDVLSFQGLKEARAYQLARREAASQGFNTWSKKGWDKVNEILLHTKERLDAAKYQAKSEGLTGSEAKRRIYELMEDSRPTKMTEDAYGFAAHGTFNHESEGTLGALTNSIAAALDAVNVGGVKPLRFIVPFTRIITNVVNNSLDFTPVGLIRAGRGVRGFRTFEKSQYTKSAFKELSKGERQRLIAKAAIGITLTAALQALHQAGVIQITGAGTDDPQKDAQLKAEGWQPYSIKIGNRWYSYQYTPLVFMTGFLGNMNDAAKYAEKESDKTFGKRMQIAASRIAGQVVDMTWINSATTFLGALSEPNPDRQAKNLGHAFSNMAKGFIPFSGAITQGSQLAQNVFNIPQKQVNGMWQALIQDIPIARNSLNDKVNALGEPITRDIDVITSKENPDPVWKYLLDKEGWVAPVNKNTIIIYDPEIGMDRPVTGDEYYEFSKLRGSKIKEKIKEIMEKGAEITEDRKKIKKTADELTTGQLNVLLSNIEREATKETKKELFEPKESKRLKIKINR